MSEQNTKGPINIVYAIRERARTYPAEYRYSMSLSTREHENKLYSPVTGLLIYPQYDLETIQSFQDVCKVTNWEF